MSERRIAPRQEANGLSDTPFELAAAFDSLAGQLESVVIDYALYESRQINGEAVPEQQPSLQEKYDIPFDPEKTVRSLGGLGLMMAPEAYLRSEASKHL